MANSARFINHSCAPNLKAQKWVVGGYTRIGMFALRDIAAGEELTFDYQFQAVGESQRECCCGAATCRRLLGAKKVAVDKTKKKVKLTKKRRRGAEGDDEGEAGEAESGGGSVKKRRSTVKAEMELVCRVCAKEGGALVPCVRPTCGKVPD